MYKYTKILLTGIAGGGAGVCLDRYYQTEIKKEPGVDVELANVENPSSIISIFKVYAHSINHTKLWVLRVLCYAYFLHKILEDIPENKESN